MLAQFITSAMAATGASGQAGGGIPELMLIAVFVVFTLFLLRSQQKRQKAQQNLVASVRQGDEIVTSGGLLGEVLDADDDFLVVSLADGVNIRLQRTAVNAILPKGTVKAIG